MINLLKARMKALKEYPPILKSKKVVINTKNGGSYEFSYTPLPDLIEATREVLENNGLVITQDENFLDGVPFVHTIMTHLPTGEMLQSRTLCPITDDDPREHAKKFTQKQRRAYGLIVGVIMEEPDAEDNNAKSVTGSPQKNVSAGGYKFTPGKPISAPQLGYIQKIIGNNDGTLRKILTHFSINSLPEMTQEKFQEALEMAKGAK